MLRINRNNKDKAPQEQDIEEELMLDNEEHPSLIRARNPEMSTPINTAIEQTQQPITNMKDYINDLTKRLEEFISIKEELDKLIQMKTNVENYINTINEILKILTEIDNQLKKLEELRSRL